MRLHHLEVQAFGPFADRHAVDVDALADAGLFLLHGDTGAGKTTLLDAVSFALFGTVPGARGGGDALRSHHADPAVPTEVVLEATLGGRRLRITRSPKQERPKKRGTGTTTDPARVSLEVHGPTGWMTRSTRLDEVGHELDALLGMGAEQFHQVVLLPQGDFATFLRADAEARRPLLERLFATGRYADVEAWLDQRAKDLAADVRDGDERLGLALQSVRAVCAGLPDDEPSDDVVPTTEGAADEATFPTAAQAVAWAEARLAEVADRHATAAAALADTDRAHRQARSAHEAAGALAERQARHARAAAVLARLDADADDQHRRRATLDAAHRAAGVVPLATQLGERRMAVAQATDRHATARRALAARRPELGEADVDELRAAAEVLVADLAELDRLDELDAERAELDDRQRRLRLDLEQAEADLAAVTAEATAAPALLDERRAALADATLAADQLDDRRRREAEAAERREAARRRDELAEACTAADQQRRVAVDAHQAAVDRHLALVQRRLDGLAVELAEGLAAGDACPVCGSDEHPAPADADAGRPEPVAADVVADAAGAADRARSRREAAEADAAEVHAQHRAAVALAGEASVVELAAALAEAASARLATEQRADEVGSCRAAVEQAIAAVDQLDQRRGDAHQAIATAQAELTAVTDRLGRLAAEVAAAIGAHGSLADRRRHCLAERRAFIDAIEATVALTTADDEAATAERRATRAALDAGFDDLGAAVVAALDEAERDRLATAIRHHDDERAAARATLDDPELVRAAAEPAPDRQATEHALAAAEQALDRATGAEAVLATVRRQLERRVAEVADAVAAVGPRRQRYDTARELAQLVAGRSDDNRLRMRLSTFVLAARLEQVAAAASERLARMSGGRYALRHTDAERDGRKRGGLGLVVVDAWSGTERDPATLSGGETFFASLALALGLADVICAESGGTRIDTLFIDEGFGSLDEATLSDVMDVLDDLRGGGRSVGIVSHVADLRDRITTQVEVRKGQHGSTLRQVTAA